MGIGILTTLLTGVSLVGKVCQGLSQAFGKDSIPMLENENGAIYEADLTVGGANFYSSNMKGTTKEFMNYVGNTTPKYMSLCLPNVNNAGGIELLIPPKEERNLAAVLDGSVPPDTEIIVGPISHEDTLNENATLNDTAIRTSINQLPLDGKPVMLAGLTISADILTNILSVQSLDTGIGVITYFSATSDKGVSAEYRDVIQPIKSNEKMRIGITQRYSIPFDDMGFKKGDLLTCRIYFSVALGNAQRIEAHSKHCSKIPESYLAHLRRTGRLKEE